MHKNYDSLDEWRIYFKAANVDIFVVIRHAIMVAAVDYPNELRENRISITEMVFACRVTKCFGCNNVELAVPNVYGEEVEAKFRANAVNEELETGKSNDIIDDKKTEEGDRNERFEMELNAAAANQTSNSGLEDADEVLSDGIDEECRTIAEVMRIKDILDNHGDEESEAVVIDSLRKLQSMTLSVETLKVTDIGKSVSPLKKQESKQIKQLVRALIEDWKAKVDEWVQAIEAAAGTECTPESAKPPVEEEEEGLPSPPMDEGAFFTISTMELSKFFDDMDEDGNLRISWEFNETHEDGRKASRENQNVPIRKQQVPKWSNAAPTEQQRAQEAVVKKPIMAASQPRYTEKPKEQEAVMRKPIMAAPQERYTEKPKEQEAIMKKPIMAAPQDKHTEKPKEQEARMKKPIMAAPQSRHTQKPKEQEARMKKPIMAAPQGRHTDEQPKEQQTVMKKPIMAAPPGRHTEQPKEQQTVMKKPIMAAPQDRYTEKPKQQEAVMKAPLMAAPQDGYTEQPKQPVAVMKMAAPQDQHTKQPKEQEAVVKKVSNAAAQDWFTRQTKEQEALVKKPSNAAAQDWYTKQQPKEQEALVKKLSNAAAQDWCTQQPKERVALVKKPSNAAAQDWYTKQPKQQEALAKKPSNAAAQHRCTQQPKEQETVLKKPSNAAAQDWYTPQPKEQEAVLKKPSNAAAQDWFTPQPKEQETVLKKPSNAAAQDWFTPQPKEQEAGVKKPTFIKPNKPSANGSGPGRLTKPTVEHKVNGNAGVKFQLKSDKRHAAVSQQNKLNCPEEITVQERLAVAKRKLQERDKAMEDAKKRRTSQSVETHNIPKQNLDPKNTQVKPGNYSKQGTNGRQ